MNKFVATTLSPFLALCLPASAVASEEPAASGTTAQYAVELQRGQHLIITNGPARRLIRVDNELNQTVSIEAAADHGVPFVHLKIERPTLVSPQTLVSAL